MLFTLECLEWFNENNSFCCSLKKEYLIGSSTIEYVLKRNSSCYLPFFINNKKVFICL